jgi:multiple sugar transport system substrate-binding protein
MHSGTQLGAITQAAKDFNASQNLVTVQLVDQVDYSTLNNKTLATLAAGSPPDAAQCYENWADKYSQSKALADLKPYINAADGLSKDDLNDFYKIMLEDGKLRGTQYMFPFNKSVYLLFYNVDMLNAAGVTSPPTTWDEVKAMAPKFTGKPNTWLMDFSDTLGQENMFEAVNSAYGGTMLDAKQKKSTFNAAPGQTVLQTWQDLVKSGAAKRVGGTSFPDQTDFQNGKTALYMSTIASYPFVKSGVGTKFKFKTAPLPGGPKGQVTQLVGTNACVFSKAPQDVQQGAFQFIKFFTSRQQTAAWSKATGYIPVRQSAVKDLADYYVTNPDLKVAPDSLPRAITSPALGAWNEAANKIQVEMTNAVDGKKTPKLALDDAAKAVDDLLSGG